MYNLYSKPEFPFSFCRLIFTKLPNPICKTQVSKLDFITIPCLKFWALTVELFSDINGNMIYSLLFSILTYGNYLINQFGIELSEYLIPPPSFTIYTSKNRKYMYDKHILGLCITYILIHYLQPEIECNGNIYYLYVRNTY